MMLSSCSNEDNTDTPPMDEVESQLRGKDGADLNIALASWDKTLDGYNFFSYE